MAAASLISCRDIEDLHLPLNARMPERIVGFAAAQVLSSREREVLQWVARGKTAPEIGCILGISKRTVDFHVSSAVQKLQAANRTHAVALAILHLLFTV
jgi:DNA-binding CsgD family transcriptional regulator